MLTTTRLRYVAAVFIMTVMGFAPNPPAKSIAAQTGLSSESAPDGHEIFHTYCTGCHNARLRTAGLSLEDLDPSSPQNAEVIERVIRKLQMGSMPPPGQKRPEPAKVQAFIASLEAERDRQHAARPVVGRTESLHRLNRAEYVNAVRDLLGLEIDRSSLPPDPVDRHGLDNNATMLSISPSLFDAYLRSAREVSRRALGIPREDPITETYRVPGLLDQDGYVSDELPLGSRGGYPFHHYFPAEGDYVLRIHLRRQLYGYIIGLTEPHSLEVRLNGERLGMMVIGGEHHEQASPWSFLGDITGGSEFETYHLRTDDKLEFKFHAKAGPGVIGLSFTSRLALNEDGPFAPVGGDRSVRDEEGNAAVESVTIAGPYDVVKTSDSDTPSRRKILTCRPAKTSDEVPCARRILGRLAQRAYRRPVSAAEVDALMSFFQKGRSGGSFDSGLQLALERLLADPSFLVRVERDPVGVVPGNTYRIGELELVSRLSFFLWSSIPDDVLLDKAIRGGLRQPTVLGKEVRRMLADSRARALIDNFVGQWLLLRNLENQTPDLRVFPDFDENLRQSLQLETQMFVRSTIEADASVVDLLTANYTFLNERLAKHYGIPGVHSPVMRRVALDPDSQRGGLLGQGSLLMVTSYPNRTSPVLRGKWILESLLGTPPPPPPPMVPGLPEKGPGAKVATVRERLELHRKNPVCATCHAAMDPLGLALEGFNAVGEHRVKSETGTVDVSAVLPDGTRFDGPTGLRTYLLGKREQFVRTLTEKLLSYALGREIEYYDQPTVRQIVREAKAQNYRWSAIILGIVNSAPFLERTASATQPLTSVARNNVGR